MNETEQQKIERIRREMKAGTYFTMAKFRVAVERMMLEIAEQN